jgi:DNA-binding MarR family transcriptional regulator
MPRRKINDEASVEVKKAPLRPPQALKGRYFVDEFIPYLLNQATNTLNQRFKKALKTHRLSISQWRVLALLSTGPNLPLMEIAARTAIDQPTLSRIVDQLVEQGLVTRAPRPSDGRFLEISLRPAGEAILERVWPIAQQHTQRALTGFSAEEEGALRNFLKRILSNSD